MATGEDGQGVTGLTMGVIGCLPDNVQQAILSFSIRPGKQHATFSFPFMANTMRRHFRSEAASRDFTPALFCDTSLQMVDGFTSFTSYVTTSQQENGSPVVVFTLYQRESDEGLKKHFQSAIRLLLDENDAISSWRMPILVHDVTSCPRDVIVHACASAIVEIQKKHLRKVFCFGSEEELIQLIGDDVVAPRIRTFEEHFEQHMDVVSTQLFHVSSSEFLGMIQRMRSPDLDAIDYHSANILMKSLASERILVKFWSIWGQEHIFSKIFPLSQSRSSSGGTESLHSSREGANLPLKEGLHSIIRALKAQECNASEVLGSPSLHGTQECACPVCKGSSFSTQSVALTHCYEAASAFHRPTPSAKTPYSDALKAAAIFPSSSFDLQRPLSLEQSRPYVIRTYPVVYKPRILTHNIAYYLRKDHS